MKNGIKIDGKAVGFKVKTFNHHIEIPPTRWQRFLSWFGLYKPRYEEVSIKGVELDDPGIAGSVVVMLYETDSIEVDLLSKKATTSSAPYPDEDQPIGTFLKSEIGSIEIPIPHDQAKKIQGWFVPFWKKN